MTNLEHLIENGLCRLDEGKSYREWREMMQRDCNWEGNENITLDNLWEICQYVIFTWDEYKEEIVRCKDCKYGSDPVEGYIACNNDIGTVDCIIHEPNWFCADGVKKS